MLLSQLTTHSYSEPHTRRPSPSNDRYQAPATTASPRTRHTKGAPVQRVRPAECPPGGDDRCEGRRSRPPLARPQDDAPLPHPQLHHPRRPEHRAPKGQQGAGGQPGEMGSQPGRAVVPVTQVQLWDFAKRVLEKAGKKEPLGQGWTLCFLRRYPEITKVNGKVMSRFACERFIEF